MAQNGANTDVVNSLHSDRLADDLLHVILPIGIALSAERNFDKLLESILIQAKSVGNADGGTLYLHEDNRINFTIVRKDSLNIDMGGTKNNAVPYHSER